MFKYVYPVLFLLWDSRELTELIKDHQIQHMHKISSSSKKRTQQKHPQTNQRGVTEIRPTQEMPAKKAKFFISSRTLVRRNMVTGGGEFHRVKIVTKEAFLYAASSLASVDNGACK